jgi:hypothetical protein
MALRALCTVLLLPCLVSGLYFHIQEGQERCFIEEMPDETLVIGESS